MVPRSDLDTTRAELIEAEAELAETKLRLVIAESDMRRALDEALKRRVAWSLLTSRIAEEGLE